MPVHLGFTGQKENEPIGLSTVYQHQGGVNTGFLTAIWNVNKEELEASSFPHIEDWHAGISQRVNKEASKPRQRWKLIGNAVCPKMSGGSELNQRRWRRSQSFRPVWNSSIKLGPKRHSTGIAWKIHEAEREIWSIIQYSMIYYSSRTLSVPAEKQLVGILTTIRKPEQESLPITSSLMWSRTGHRWSGTK